MRNITQRFLLGLLALAVTAPAAWGAGFAIYEHSAKASGMAGAFTAQADDASANWYNPAALVWLEGSEFQVGANLITAGSDTEFTSQDLGFGIPQETTFQMDSHLVTPAHLYYSHKFNSNFALGIGINTPFGLITDWVDRPVTFSAAESELVTFMVNVNLAMRLTEHTAVAVGIDYVDAEIKSFSREVPIDLDGNPLNGFEVVGASNLTGSGDEIGWNVALHHRGQGWNFGFSYRSDITVTLDGTLDFENFGPLSPFFFDRTGTADLELPDQAAIGLSWQGGRGWVYEVDVTWQGWSVFDNLVIDLDNEIPGLVEDIVLREDWDDAFAYRFGAQKTAGKNVYRLGFVYDEQTVPNDTLRPSIPDADRYGPTVGYTRNNNNWSVDFYYFPLFFSETDAVGNEDGVIEGTYKSFVNLAGATFRVRF